jgi:hypothetical protein
VLSDKNMTIQTASWIYQWGNIATIVFIILSAISGAMTYYASNVKESYSDAKTAEISELLRREVKKNSQRLISEEQSNILIKELESKNISVLFVIQRDWETEAYASQIMTAFSKAKISMSIQKMLPGASVRATNGVIMYKPGQHSSEADYEGDPLYTALKKSELLGGFCNIATLSLDDWRPDTPTLNWDSYIIYVGQKSPW